MGLLETLATGLALCFVFMGFWGRSIMLNKNACQMTYTSHAKAKIEVSSSVPGVGELYRHPATDKLNPQPVLFIHGHLGKADQVRSLSSPMHNDDNFFQYFAVDFKDNTGSAVHGSGLLTQAVFVNDAIRAILKLYESDSESPRSKTKPGVKVMLVGHSIGGMVARTAVLLSNHPHTNALDGAVELGADKASPPLTAACAVSDIIMLSTPNKASPYSLDGSMHAVYNTVNQGWYKSHYSASKDCATAQEQMRFQLAEVAEFVSSGKQSGAKGSAQHVCGLTNNTRNYQSVRFRSECSVCAPQVRLLSITGGDMDMHVPAHLTGLSMIHPRAHNATNDPSVQRTLTGRPLGRGEGGVISSLMRGLGLKWTLGIFQAATQAANPLRILGAVKTACASAVQWVRGMAGGAADVPEEGAAVVPGDIASAGDAGTVAGAVNADAGISVSDEEVSPPAAVEAEVEEPAPAAAAARPDFSNYTYGHLMHLQQDNWDEHISPYVDSQHYSIRSLQMRECGFVVDHLAIVWCRQLVHAVSDAMRTLARNPSDLNDPRIATAAKEAIDKGEKGNKYTDAGGRINWDTLLPSRKNSTSRQFYAKAAAEAPLMIPQVASFHLKNATNHAFLHLAPVEELQYISSKMNWGLADAMSIWYISNHLGSILAAYVFIGIMILCIPLRRRVTNWSGVNKSDAASLDFSSLKAAAHLHLEDIIPTAFMVVTPLLNMLLPPAVLSSEAYKKFIAACMGTKTASVEHPVYEEKFFLRFIKACLPLLVLTAVIFAKVAYVDYYQKGTRSAAKLLDDHKGHVALIVSYYAAIALRFAVCVCIFGVRFILGGTWYICSSVLYKKLTPKVLRKLLKKMRVRICSVLPPAAAYLPIVATSIASLLVFFSYARFKEANVLSRWEYSLSVITVGVVGASMLAHMRALFLPVAGSGEFEHLQTSFALLYIPVFILAVPSTIYSIKLIFVDTDMYANAYDTFVVFSAERMNFLVGALGIFLQWTVMTHWCHTYAHLGDVAGASWLISALGRPPSRCTGASSERSPAAAAAAGQGWGSSVAVASGDHACCHEDGGRYATFEEVMPEVTPAAAEVAVAVDAKAAANKSAESGSKSSQTRSKSPAPVSAPLSRSTSANDVSHEVSQGVLLGCTYRVVHCECFRDKRLKDTSDWCEFCLCPRCGMKNLPKDYYADKSRNAQSNSSSWWGDGGSDDADSRSTSVAGVGTAQYPYSANLILLLCLLCVAAKAAGNFELPHQQFTYLGGVAWSFLARDYLVHWRVLLP